MGQSVLIPEEDLLGKVGEPAAFVVVHSLGNGRKGIRSKIPKPARGERSHLYGCGVRL